jgi:hypothetical protein
MSGLYFHIAGPLRGDNGFAQPAQVEVFTTLKGL